MAPVKSPALRRALARQAPSLLVFLAVLGLWQIAVSGLRIREYILPSPLAVLRALSLSDIPWLRQAANKAGAQDVPTTIAHRLLTGGLVELHTDRLTLRITKRGQLALTRLG